MGITCTFVGKTLPSTLGGVDGCELYYWLAKCFGRASCRCSIFNNCLWVLWHGWLLLMWCSVKIMLLLESFTYLMCMSIPICRIWQSFMIIRDHYIIKWHVSHAWYGCWTIKALLEAEVSCDGFFCETRGNSSSMNHCQAFTVSHINKNNKPSKKIYFLRQNALLTLVVYIHFLWLAKELPSNFQKTFVKKKCFICLWCIPVHFSHCHCVTLHFICWGSRLQCILMRLTV